MTVDIKAVEIGGKFWVSVVIDDHENRHGPFFSADEAAATARRLLRFGRALASPSEWR
jgi:hypothetical protein